MLCALYARVACVSPGDGRACDRQLSTLREDAERRGWCVYAEYADAGESGVKASRPQVDKLMQAASERRFDSVLCLTVDRLDRSLENCSRRLEQLQSYGVEVFIAAVD